MVVEAHSSFRSCRSPEISAHGAGEVELHAGSHRPRPARGQGSKAGSRPGDGKISLALRSNCGQQPGLNLSFSSKGPAWCRAFFVLLWVGDSCPTLLTLMLIRGKSRASDRSVRPTQSPDPASLDVVV